MSLTFCTHLTYMWLSMKLNDQEIYLLHAIIISLFWIIVALQKNGSEAAFLKRGHRAKKLGRALRL